MRNYFGRDISPRQVVVGMEAHNPASDPLRAELMRIAQAPAASAATPAPAPQGSAAPQAVITPGPGTTTGRVQTESLSAPPRSGTR